MGLLSDLEMKERYLKSSLFITAFMTDTLVNNLIRSGSEVKQTSLIMKTIPNRRALRIRRSYGNSSCCTSRLSKDDNERIDKEVDIKIESQRSNKGKKYSGIKLNNDKFKYKQ